jgi:3-mercaptopyruvate sulfurtransferase SseA
LANDDRKPSLWSVLEMPGGTSSALISTRVLLALTAVTAHVIVIVPAKDESSESNSTGLDNPIIADDLDKPNIHNVGVDARLAARFRGLRIDQPHPVRPSGASVEVLELTRHSMGRKPLDERLRFYQRGVHPTQRSVNDQRGGIGSSHTAILPKRIVAEPATCTSVAVCGLAGFSGITV